MRFLFTAKHPPAGDVAFGGVASWILTLKAQLEKRGHECVVWGPKLPEPWGRFDVGVLSNYKATKSARHWCDRVINVSHGIVDEERPAQHFSLVSTSEEVRDKWACGGGLLRQPIDLQFWRGGGKRRDCLVLYSYRARGCFGVDRLADRLRLAFVHLRNVPAKEAREALQCAALVCASGRAALEAMACEAPTLICDDRDYNGGPLLSFSIDQARRTNYSGRGGVDPRSIDLEVLAREAMTFSNSRAYVKRWHDAERIADELLALC